MPRKKLTLLPGQEQRREDCFAFYIDKAGAPGCRALQDVYCLKENKPCAFRATPEAAAAAKQTAHLRLSRIGRI